MRNTIGSNAGKFKTFWIPIQIGLMENERAGLATKTSASAPLIMDRTMKKFDVKNILENN